MNKEYEDAKREFETWDGINDILASKAKKKMDLLEKEVCKNKLDDIIDEVVVDLKKPKKTIKKKTRKKRVKKSDRLK